MVRTHSGACVAAVMLLVAGCGASATTRATPAHTSLPVTRTQPGLPFPAAGTAALPTALVARLRAALDTATDPAQANNLAGVTVAAVTPAGTWSYAAGRDGAGAPLVPDDAMAIGSISKTFTAAETMLLAARGKIDLDAPLSRYVSSPLLARHPTVRQALGMVSGITDGSGDTAWYSNLAAEAAKNENATLDLASSVALDRARPVAPGVRQAYSNANFLLLAEAIQNVTYQPLATLLRQDLIDPAGLGRVAVQDAERPAAPVAYPIAGGSDAPVLRDGFLPDRAMASGALGCGSLAADAPSIARWGYELYGARLLPVSTVDRMTTPQLAATFGYGIGYGLGTVIYNKTLGSARGTLVGHDGLIYRSLPDGTQAGYQTFLVVDLVHRFFLAVFVPTTQQRTQEIQLVGQLVTLLQQAR